MQGQHRFLLILTSGFSSKHKAAHPGLQGLTSQSLERDPGAPAGHQPLGRVRIQQQHLRRRMIQLELLPLLQPWLQASMVLASLQSLKGFPPPVTSGLLGRCHSQLGLQAVAIAALAHRIAGSEAAFRDRPFLSLNVNHVVPPLRFDPDSVDVLIYAARRGIPVMVNTFGQLGASSPVTIAGCVAQTTAETLAGMVLAWLSAPDARAIFGPRPMVTDLRTGAMAGGGGEQAKLTAAAIQMARRYGLPSSTIAGASDSKWPDAQAGHEKCLSVTLALQAGADFVTQAAGTQASLMATALESYVIDNDMLGSILSAHTAIEVSEATLDPAAIHAAATGAGHFLGEAETLARMNSDFLYPQIGDRRTIGEWQDDGGADSWKRAHSRVREILAAPPPSLINAALAAQLEIEFDLRRLSGEMNTAQESQDV